jgi:hypothetical protein
MAGGDTEHLVAAIKHQESELRLKRDATEAREDERLEKLAILDRTDVELDDLVRLVELEVQIVVGKDRSDPRYQRCFPDGLSAMVALRGEDEARAVHGLVQALAKDAPEAHKRHEKKLEALARATASAETAWKQAELDAAIAFTAEVVARRELVRQLQKNEGALQTLFPGQKRLVRTFFRQTRRGSGGDSDGGGTPTSQG